MTTLCISTKFVNSEHQRLYDRARKMLDDELSRQKKELKRLMPEFERYPAEIRNEKIAWLMRHFAKCRMPYEKILIDVLSICPTIMMVPARYLHS